jgi:hypothetical protein
MIASVDSDCGVGVWVCAGRLVIRNSLRVLGVLEKPKREGRQD